MVGKSEGEHARADIAHDWNQTFDTIPDLISILDLQHRFRRVNRAQANQIGLAPEACIGLSFCRMVHGVEHPIAACPHTRLLADHKEHSAEVHDARSGNDYLITVSPLFDEHGKLTGSVHVARDVSARKKTEAALRQSEERFSKAFHGSPAATAITRLRDECFTDVNEAMAALLGYRREELIGHTGTECGIWAHADDRALVRETLRRGTSIHDREIHLRTRDARELTTRYSAGMFNIGGEPSILSVLVDITEAREAIRGQEQANSLLRATLDATADGILVVDRDNRIVDFNRQFVQLWRIPQELLALREDQKALDYVLDQLKYPQQFQAKVQELYANPEADSFDRLAFRDGRTFERYSHPQWIKGLPVGRVWSFRDVTDRKKAEVAQHESETRLRAILDTVHTGVIVIDPATYHVADISALKQMEAQILQAQKMDAVGRLAGGVAHDFNNIVQVILGFSDIVLTNLAENHPHRQDVQEIKGADIQVSAQYAPDLKLIHADAGQISQVVMNLAVNARDAMPHGGQLSISTANVTVAAQEIATMPAADPGSFVCLTVADNGSGMTEHVRAHLFEPFFTTKDSGKGTGLGLSVVYGIVKQCNGWIRVDSREGFGSTFRVYFPVYSGSSRGATAENSASGLAAMDPALRGNGERILLVEDDTIVCNLAAKMLQSANYQVVSCTTAQEALSRLREKGQSFDLLFSDVVLPDRNGIALADEARLRDPRLSILLCSGYTDERSRRKVIKEKGYLFLQKPYAAPGLLHLIRQLLDARLAQVSHFAT
ncbi:MAG: PAS domain S-box protein [bacterium]